MLGSGERGAWALSFAALVVLAAAAIILSTTSAWSSSPSPDALVGRRGSRAAASLDLGGRTRGEEALQKLSFKPMRIREGPRPIFDVYAPYEVPSSLPCAPPLFFAPPPPTLTTHPDKHHRRPPLSLSAIAAVSHSSLCPPPPEVASPSIPKQRRHLTANPSLINLPSSTTQRLPFEPFSPPVPLRDPRTRLTPARDRRIRTTAPGMNAGPYREQRKRRVTTTRSGGREIRGRTKRGRRVR